MGEAVGAEVTAVTGAIDRAATTFVTTSNKNAGCADAMERRIL